MRLLVTGASGQLGRALAERAALVSKVEIVPLCRPAIDLAVPGSAARAIADVRGDLVVNAAAFTAVDLAEQQPELAFRVNAEGAGEIAAAAALAGLPVIHVSTDYVFGGAGQIPLTEDMPAEPRTTYGRTKLAGEQRVGQANADHLILRTSWLYGPNGSNFVRTMLRLARERDEVAVVADQRGCPTSALDLADAILALCQRRLAGDRSGWGEAYHAAGAAPASWAQLAEGIFAESRRLGGPTARVRPIASADYPTPAQRPLWSVLDGRRLDQQFGLVLPPWQTSLPPIIERLLGEAAPRR